MRLSKTATSPTDGVRVIVGIILAVFLVWVIWASFNSSSISAPALTSSIRRPFQFQSNNEEDADADAVNSLNCGWRAPPGGQLLRCEPKDPTFYDDPTLRFSIEKPIADWDRKRRQWLKYHPSYAVGLEERVLVVTGSQPSECPHPKGDHMLLRFFKNKVDYCRLHGYDIFYNNAVLHPKMSGCWSKIQTIRSAMMAHPESEWIFWVDSDAAFTDMDFKVPLLERYKDHNLVVHGWPHLIYDKKSWVSINAGVFLIRNSQWAMDFLKEWATMGPQTPNYEEWGKIQSSTFKDKLFPQADDQSGMVYMLLKQKDKWGDKTYIENQYALHGYWIGIVGRLDNITEQYERAEATKLNKRLRRRHAEKVTEHYGQLWEPHLPKQEDGWRRPFITHFTGCQPCSGHHSPEYEGNKCWDWMNMALNFADNQVLKNYGFMHPNLQDSSVSPVATRFFDED